MLRGAAITIGAQLQPALMRKPRSDGVEAAAAGAAAEVDRSAAQRGTSEIFIANFIEDIAGQVVGYGHVGSFIAECVIGLTHGGDMRISSASY